MDEERKRGIEEGIIRSYGGCPEAENFGKRRQIEQKFHEKRAGGYVPDISGDASFGSFRGFFAAESGAWKIREIIQMIINKNNDSYLNK